MSPTYSRRVKLQQRSHRTDPKNAALLAFYRRKCGRKFIDCNNGAATYMAIYITKIERPGSALMREIVI